MRLSENWMLPAACLAYDEIALPTMLVDYVVWLMLAIAVKDEPFLLSSYRIGNLSILQEYKVSGS